MAAEWPGPRSAPPFAAAVPARGAPRGFQDCAFLALRTATVRPALRAPPVTSSCTDRIDLGDDLPCLHTGFINRQQV